MKFIRDIINEKKNAGEFGAQPLSATPLVRGDQSFEDEPGDLSPLDLKDFASMQTAEVPPSEAVEIDTAVEPDTESVESAIPEMDEDAAEEQVVEAADPMGNLFADPTTEAEDESPWAEPEPEAWSEPETDETAAPEPEQEAANEIPAWEPPVALDAAQSNDERDEAQPVPTMDNPVAEDPMPDPVVIPVEVPKPATGRAASRSGRVKTRLLGFSTPDSSSPDPFGKAGETTAAGYSSFPVGWLVVTEGPGRGAAFTLFDGLTQIGRGEGQTVRLNFGDNSISRENHAAIAFDAEQSKFYFGHGGKANLVRLNGRPVLSTEEMPSDSQIRIGETTLRFVALCGEKFTWGTDEQKVAVNDVAG